MAWAKFSQEKILPISDHLLQRIGPQCSRITMEQVHQQFTGPRRDAIIDHCVQAAARGFGDGWRRVGTELQLLGMPVDFNFVQDLFRLTDLATWTAISVIIINSRQARPLSFSAILAAAQVILRQTWKCRLAAHRLVGHSRIDESLVDAPPRTYNTTGN